MTSVTIKSDGQPRGTRILAADGQDISNKIAAVTFRHTVASHIPMAEIELAFVSIDATNVSARMIGPGGKEVRRIEYADGTVDEFGSADRIAADDDE